MNLSSRTVLLISPVIVLSFMAASLGAYWAQKSSIIQKEKTIIEGKMAKLKASYNEVQTYSHLFLLSIGHSNILRNYLSSSGRASQRVHRHGLNELLNEFSIKRQHDVSFTVVRAKSGIDFHFNSVSDPFRIEPQWQEDRIHQILETSKNEPQSMMYDSKGDLHLFVLMDMNHRELYAAVDAKDKRSDAVKLLASSEMSLFNQIRYALEEEYQGQLVIHNKNDSFVLKEIHDFTLPLSDAFDMTFVIPAEHFSQKEEEVKRNVIIWFLILTSLTVLCLSLLIRRYITLPISLLEKNLSDVIENENREIVTLKSNDELGRLSKTFRALHRKLFTAYAETVQMAEIDLLTGLPNRLKFNSLAEVALDVAKKEHSNLSILFLDLDNFKYVNDKYGHEVGDELLKYLSLQLQELIETSYLNHPGGISLGRLGGDEFALLVPFGDKMLSTQLAKLVLNLFKDGFSFDLGNFPISVSMGISIYPFDGDDLETLLMKADASMYQSKVQGKNKFSFYSSTLASQINRRSEVERALSKACFDDEFYLVYMPIISGPDSHVAGVEVLLRWNSPDLGMIPPDEFITIAESKGYFYAIDCWVIEKAFSDLSTLQSNFDSDFTLSINISSAELTSKKILNFIKQKALALKVNSDDVIFEITETFEVEFSYEVKEVLQEFRQAGYRLAIDDFGTGHTSLLQMIEYPAETIKFDRSLVDKLYNQQHHQLASTLVNLCHGQDFKVTAEGVESYAQLTFLLECGCDHFQGFYFSKPLPLHELIKRFRSKEAILNTPSTISLNASSNASSNSSS